MTIALFIISFFLLLFLGVPIAFALGLSSLLGISLHDSLPLMSVAQRMFIALNSFPLMAIPFFILAGAIMQAGGMSKRLVNFASSLVGHFTGGLAMVAVVTSMFFGAISGSTTATTIAVGSILIPSMITRGYNPAFASANLAVSGSLGGIIPPSIGMILYGVVAQVSTGDMFIAGIVPGLVITLTLVIAVYIISKRESYSGVKKSSFLDIWQTFKQSFLALVLPVIILGGIYTGSFTPTEAAIIAVAYSFLVGVVIYRELKLRDIMKVLQDSATTTAVIMIIIATAGIFSYYINIIGIPDQLASLMSSFTSSTIVFLIFVNLLLLLAGMFLEGAAAILILVPLLLPMALEYGIDPIHFGMIIIVNLSIGLVTPPIGMNLFAAERISNVGIVPLIRAVVPFIFVLLINLVLVTLIPQLSTYLPSIMKH